MWVKLAAQQGEASSVQTAPPLPVFQIPTGDFKVHIVAAAAVLESLHTAGALGSW